MTLKLGPKFIKICQIKVNYLCWKRKRGEYRVGRFEQEFSMWELETWEEEGNGGKRYSCKRCGIARLEVIRG